MQLRYSFDGVDCPNCASTIERKIAKHSQIESVQMDFSQCSLRIVARDGVPVDKLEKDVRTIFAEVEDTAVIRRVDQPESDPGEARRFTLPEGEFDSICNILYQLGAEIAQEDPKARTVVLTTGRPWHELLCDAEARSPGILPYVEEVIGDNAEDEKALRRARTEKITLAGGLIAFLLSLALEHLVQAPQPVVIAAFAATYLLSAYPVLIATFKSIRNGNPFDENFLMSVATIGAFIIGENAEGVLVMLLYRLGELFQDKAVGHSRDSIKKLLALKPDHANLLIGGRAVTVDPAFVRVGDRIEVRPGERVPLDGVVVEGATSLDVSDMTGESAPRDIAPGDEALSGAINGGGLITLTVTQAAGDSQVARVLKLVEESTSYKARRERVFTRFARVYTPIVCAAALLVMLIPPLLFGQDWYTWIYRGLSFLVVSCPCALVLSIPLSFFGGVGAASKRGVLVKGGECLETLARVDTAVFDKTGTLTEGVMEVAEIRPEEGFTKESLLSLAAAAESRLNHPISAAIVRAAGTGSMPAVSDYENIPGEGIRCKAGDTNVAVGNLRLMERVGAAAAKMDGTIAYVAVNGRYAGLLRLEDRVRPDASEALSQLKQMGFKKTAMLTGDNAATAQSVAKRLGIDEVRAELLPDQKVGALKEISMTSEKGCLFVGDGVNDAPVLAAADVGVAMGGIGSDAAISAADMVLLSGNIGRIGEAVSIARKTRVNVSQNIALALGVKLAAMALIALGVGEMWMAVIADAGVALLCVLNALRLTRTSQK